MRISPDEDQPAPLPTQKDQPAPLPQKRASIAEGVANPVRKVSEYKRRQSERKESRAVPWGALQPGKSGNALARRSSWVTKQKKVRRPWYVITTDWKDRWDVLITFQIIWIAIIIPFDVAFIHRKADDSFAIAVGNANWVFDGLMLLDPVVHCLSTVPLGRGLYIFSVKELSTRYLNHGHCVIDCICALCVVLAKATDDKVFKWLLCLKLVRFHETIGRASFAFPLISLVLDMAYTKLFTHQGISRLCELLSMLCLFQVIREKLQISIRSAQFLTPARSPPSFTPTRSHPSQHWVACSWYAVALWGVPDVGYTVRCHEGALEESSWIAAKGKCDEADLDVYLSSLYFSFMTITTVGYCTLACTTPCTHTPCTHSVPHLPPARYTRRPACPLTCSRWTG
jgi:hypothetical protein